MVGLVRESPQPKSPLFRFKHYSLGLGGGNSNMFLFSPRKLGEDAPILTCASFSNGLVQPPTRLRWCLRHKLLDFKWISRGFSWQNTPKIYTFLWKWTIAKGHFIIQPSFFRSKGLFSGEYFFLHSFFKEGFPWTLNEDVFSFWKLGYSSQLF